MAAGPPLDDPPPAADRLGSVREESRPTEPRPAWVGAVGRAAVPDTKALASAITAADPAALQLLARAYVAAAEKLRTEPDPAGPIGREESARYRLSLLVRADAARASQLATVVGDPAVGAKLAVTARRIALVADGITVDGVPNPPSGFDPSLLVQSGG